MTSMVKSILHDYSGAYILVNWTITITGNGTEEDAKQRDGRNKGAIFKNCTPFTDSISKMNNNQGTAKYLDVVMPMHNLIEYSNEYKEYKEVDFSACY